MTLWPARYHRMRVSSVEGVREPGHTTTTTHSSTTTQWWRWSSRGAAAPQHHLRGATAAPPSVTAPTAPGVCTIGSGGSRQHAVRRPPCWTLQPSLWRARSPFSGLRSGSPASRSRSKSGSSSGPFLGWGEASRFSFNSLRVRPTELFSIWRSSSFAFFEFFSSIKRIQYRTGTSFVQYRYL